MYIGPDPPLGQSTRDTVKQPRYVHVREMKIVLLLLLPNGFVLLWGKMIRGF